jgi:Rrf2 family transcriptional regulator, iron-sulfur cluster assembly transcription factor
VIRPKGNDVITKTGMHAVRAMTVLAQLPEGTFAGAARVAQEIGAPPNYLGKLLQTLAHEGLVQSQKGLGGGFCLARDPRRISLFDVVEPIERLERWSGCVLGRPTCSDEHPCAIHNRWKKVRTAYLDLLKHTTIADLVARGEVAALLA